VGTAGDVNGDGYADIIVGADWYSLEIGRAYVYHGGAGGLSGTPALTLTGEAANSFFGSAVETAGDLNRDGFADVIIGAYGHNSNTGRVYVYHGRLGGLSATPAVTLSGEAVGDYFGAAVGTAGDVNGDGYADVIVGAGGHRSETGRVYLYYGGPGGLSVPAAYTFDGEAIRIGFGYAVGTAGDANGDGYADLIVGAPRYDSYTGRAYVYQSNDTSGWYVLAQQARGDGSGMPVQPWGLSHNPEGFTVRLTATDPLVSGRVKLEVQTCLPGVPFGDASCVSHISTTWTDVTTATDDVTLTETISGLYGGVLYRWRARALYDAPLTIRGPWRRFQGQAQEADVRTNTTATALSIGKHVAGAGGFTQNLRWGDVVTYTIELSNSGKSMAIGVVITDELPADVVFGGWLERAGAQSAPPGDTITWYGAVPPKEQHIIRFAANIANPRAIAGQTISNRVWFNSTNAGAGWDETGFSVAHAFDVYLPVVFMRKRE
jgi:uncharacterized repeat protein (TIGR01451 family)